jgi:spermidine synthase
MSSDAMLLLYCLLLLAGVCVASPTHDHDPEKLIRAQIDWLISRGGTVNSKMHFRRTNPNDSRLSFGLFAIEDIHEGDTLLIIPQNCLIRAGGDLDECGGLCCPVARRLIHEMRLGDDSEFAPFVNYLLSQRHGQLPSAWSEVGQSLLLDILAQNDADINNDLSPEGICDWLKNDWRGFCEGSQDPFEENAAMLALQRSWDDVIIPIFDMIKHRNGRWLNTNSTSVHDKSMPLQVWASRNIKAGEEIFNSYTFCTDCKGRFTGYGTPEILRDFGFVERYPQQWFFDTTVWFEVDAEYDEQGADTGNFIVNWLQEYPPSLNEIRAFIAKLDRLNRVADIEFDFMDLAIPKNEWDVIVEFYNATSHAMRLALISLGVNYTEKHCTGGSDEACSLTTRYDNLAFKEDRIDYAVYTCDSSLSLAIDNFTVLEDMQSHYQNISFAIDPTNSNVCLDIENTIQICDSYRPQYHEMVTHYTARFLSQVKRVLFVGGGDSMLLHEIIKYKSLEIVVGLELDQYITRLSFKHTGTQPHFDNPKVQWWYGDASKSLLMLPESFFGSFDMVLVDLSETVASLLVTDRLDILQALSLLLKPDGIFVKNELYLDKMADIFGYR